MGGVGKSAFLPQLDFYCKSLSLVIEIDGCIHDSEDAVVSDLKRQEILEEMGLKLLRFNGLDVKRNLAGVLKVIEKFIVALKRDSYIDLFLILSILTPFLFSKKNISGSFFY